VDIGDDYTVTLWRHLKCFRPPAGMLFDHLLGIKDLSAEERAAVHRHMSTVGKAKPASKKPMKPADDEDEGEARYITRDRKAPHPLMLTSLFSCLLQIREKYQSMHVEDLKEVLRANEQLLGGLKDELVERCVDGEMHGGLPKCTTCGIGRLKVSEHDAHLYCPGYWDEAAAVFVRCAFRASPDKVARIPWNMPGGKKSKKAKRTEPESGGAAKQAADEVAEEVAEEKARIARAAITHAHHCGLRLAFLSLPSCHRSVRSTSG
jgi:hypothetical protein